MKCGLIRCLVERKFGRLVEIEAQCLPIFGAWAKFGYFAIVSMMGFGTLQRQLEARDIVF